MVVVTVVVVAVVVVVVIVVGVVVVVAVVVVVVAVVEGLIGKPLTATRGRSSQFAALKTSTLPVFRSHIHSPAYQRMDQEVHAAPCAKHIRQHAHSRLAVSCVLMRREPRVTTFGGPFFGTTWHAPSALPPGASCRPKPLNQDL